MKQLLAFAIIAMSFIACQGGKGSAPISTADSLRLDSIIRDSLRQDSLQRDSLSRHQAPDDSMHTDAFITRRVTDIYTRLLKDTTNSGTQYMTPSFRSLYSQVIKMDSKSDEKTEIGFFDGRHFWSQTDGKSSVGELQQVSVQRVDTTSAVVNVRMTYSQVQLRMAFDGNTWFVDDLDKYRASMTDYLESGGWH